MFVFVCVYVLLLIFVVAFTFRFLFFLFALFGNFLFPPFGSELIGMVLLVSGDFLRFLLEKMLWFWFFG